MTETGFAYEVPVWEPSTQGSAIESVPWARSSADVRHTAVRIWLTTVVLAGTFWWVWAVGASWIVVVLLGLATAVGVLLSMTPVILTMGGRMDCARLESRSWRRATVVVFAPRKGEAGLFGGEARLLVDGDTERAMWLSWSPASWAEQQVLARTRRIWLVGPDSEGKVLFCSTGCAVANCTAAVVVDDGETVGPVRPEQVAPARLPSAADDVVTSAALVQARRLLRMTWWWPVAPLVPALAVLTVVLMNGGPRTGESLAGVGVVLAVLAAGAISGMRGYLKIRRVGRLLTAGPWTAVPVTLEPGTKLVDRAVTIRLSAILTDGHASSVRLDASYPLTANIADTGQLWVAGEPVAGRVVAAGLPGYPVYSIAHIGR